MPSKTFADEPSQAPEVKMELQNSLNTFDDGSVLPVQSILETMKNFISAVEDMDETVLIPSRLRDMPACQTSPTQAVPPENGNGFSQKEMLPVSNGNDISLYSHYAILKALRTELVSGPTSEKDQEDLEELEEDIASKKLQIATARMFRHHLNGVVNTMQQLTLMCDRVTSQYRSEFDDHQSSLKPKAFAV